MRNRAPEKNFIGYCKCLKHVVHFKGDTTLNKKLKRLQVPAALIIVEWSWETNQEDYDIFLIKSPPRWTLALLGHFIPQWQID